LQLTQEQALREYARMINTLDERYLEPLLAEDFSYASQNVLSELSSRTEFLEYIRGKIATWRSHGTKLYAQMGTIRADFAAILGIGGSPCVIVAQGTRVSQVATVLAKVDGDKLKRLDMCIVPSPSEAIGTGDYPT
jgi:hypothetical protein